MIFIKRLLAALLALLFIAAVSSCKHVIVSDDDDVNNISDDDDLTPTLADDDDASIASLTGIVLDAYGQPLGEVVVALLGSDVATTSDNSGRFELENLIPSARAIVTFRKEAYARTSVPIELRENVENTIIQRMAVIDHVFTFDSTAGYTFGNEEPLKLEFPSNNVIDEQGEVYNGSVVVEVTVFDLVSTTDNGNEVLATPGDFTAVDSVGEEKTLESYGMVQVNMTTPSGADLQLGSQVSVIRLPVQNLGAPPVVGDEISAWSYNETLGKWEEEAVGTVTEFEGTLVWEFSAPHFSTWNCDRPISTHGCLTGRVTDSQGSPRGGATVRAVGITYISTTTSRTGQDGSFCLEVKNGETVWAEISYSIAGQIATQRTDPTVIPAGQASCSLGEGTCVDLGEIPVDIQTCVTGIVINNQNIPQADVQVFSPQGGLATTDNDGAFCMTTTVFQDTAVYAQSQLDGILYQPVEAYTQPGTPNCQGGCPNLVILRPYVDTSCAHGNVVINGNGASVLVSVYDNNFPAAAIGSTLSASDGSFCASVPANVSATLQVGVEPDICGSETVSLDNFAGSACGDTGQSTAGSECYPLEDFNCNI